MPPKAVIFSVEPYVCFVPEADTIRRAFEAVWTTLYATCLLKAQSQELKITLSQTPIALAAYGITDPQELRRKALERMALSSR